MAAPRKLPPDGAAPEIEHLAAEGFSFLGIAAHFKVSRECFKRWLDEDEALNEAFEIGRETERQALHALVVASAKANKPANVNAFFLLKARHGYVETDNRTKVNVDIAVNNVLVVKDHGTVDEWAAKAAAQQRALTADCTRPLQIEAPKPVLVDAVASFAPTDDLPAVYAPWNAPAPIPAPEAPSWVAPVQEPVPASAAPYYGPPAFNWQAPTTPAPSYAPEPVLSAPVAPCQPPVWRGRA